MLARQGTDAPADLAMVGSRQIGDQEGLSTLESRKAAGQFMTHDGPSAPGPPVWWCFGPDCPAMSGVCRNEVLEGRICFAPVVQTGCPHHAVADVYRDSHPKGGQDCGFLRFDVAGVP